MKDSSKDITARLIEYNASEFFLKLGRLNMDEVCDIPEIKYIFTKKFESRIFMANFDKLNIIDKIFSRIEELNISAHWYVSPFSNPSNLKKLLNEYNFFYLKDWTAMAIDLAVVSGNFEQPRGLEIKEVTNQQELNVWTDILIESFDIQGFKSELYKKYFLNLGVGNNLNFNYYLGKLNGKPVASSILFKGNDTAGMYYVGILPEVRRGGLAKSMVKYLLNKAKSIGYKISVLHASETGYPLYKDIGFKKYYTTNIYKKSKLSTN